MDIGKDNITFIKNDDTKKLEVQTLSPYFRTKLRYYFLIDHMSSHKGITEFHIIRVCFTGSIASSV